MKKIALTVIMPALNEDKNIESAIKDTLRAFDDIEINGEIIVINDGSTDKTEALVNRIVTKEPRVRITSHPSPKGIGRSFWEGVDLANGEVVVMMPGDNENDAPEIFRYYNLLEHVDIVIPFIFNKEKRPLFRNALSFIYRFIINATFVVNFNYTNGTVLYRKSILKELTYRSSSFFFQTDILIRLVKHGYLFAEVPYKLGMREHGRSKAVSFPSFVNVVKGYLRLVRDNYFTDNTKTKTSFSSDSLTEVRRQSSNVTK